MIQRTNSSNKKKNIQPSKKPRTLNEVRSVHWKRELRMYVSIRSNIKTLAVGRRMLALDQYTFRSFRN